MEPLPFIDEYSLPVEAPVEIVWAALVDVLRRGTRSGKRFARLLGCDPREETPEFAGRSGETVPGFRVVDADPGRRLALRGCHRFAHYALTFTLDGEVLRAETRAAFPGVLGRLYRAAVIGSGGHRLVTRSLLRKVVSRSTR